MKLLTALYITNEADPLVYTLFDRDDPVQDDWVNIKTEIRDRHGLDLEDAAAVEMDAELSDRLEEFVAKLYEHDVGQTWRSIDARNTHTNLSQIFSSRGVGSWN